MKRLLLCCVWLTTVIFSPAQTKFDLQGHRGCRGLMPENTIPAFIKAVDLGVMTLELDVYSTKDHQMVVSHEGYMLAATCLDSLGHEITKENEKNFKLYTMTMDQIRKFDCGIKPYPAFPRQQRMHAYKPSLKELVTAVEQHVKEQHLQPVYYKVEIKSWESGDDIYHPKTAPYVEMLMAELNSLGVTPRCVLQSFDLRPLQYLHSKYPEVVTALLYSNKLSVDENLTQLGYQPQIMSPDYHLVTRELVEQVHKSGMQLIPWTVNTKEEMLKLIDLGVDAIITDYPDMLK